MCLAAHHIWYCLVRDVRFGDVGRFRVGVFDGRDNRPDDEGEATANHTN